MSRFNVPMCFKMDVGDAFFALNIIVVKLLYIF